MRQASRRVVADLKKYSLANMVRPKRFRDSCYPIRRGSRASLRLSGQASAAATLGPRTDTGYSLYAARPSGHLS
jgi:hypothetical protein